MKVRFTERSIEITKTFANKASRFGSEEYNMLLAAMHDLPDFKVVVKATPKHYQTYMKGLTYDYMAAYIARVDEDGSTMREFEILRQGCNYNRVRNWFLTLFPEFNNFAA